MKQSAGILPYKFDKEELFLFLVHPGGPFWNNKDSGSWSIAKGEFTSEESAISAAVREFHEETGVFLQGDFLELSPVKLKSGKLIFGWAIASDIDENRIKSNEFEMEWPPRSGKMQLFPEIDKAAWFSFSEALQKVNEAQRGFILELQSKVQR